MITYFITLSPIYIPLALIVGTIGIRRIMKACGYHFTSSGSTGPR